jgi:hypothetical protein
VLNLSPAADGRLACAGWSVTKRVVNSLEF